MTDELCTLTSPLPHAAGKDRPLLALTIVWHPDIERVGEQFVAAEQSSGWEVSRYAPLFRRAGGPELPLGHSGISREPLRITRDTDDNVSVHFPNTKMVIELNSCVVQGSVRLIKSQIDTGQLLTLGRAVVLCLHWMTVLPKPGAIAAVTGVGSAAIMLRDQIRMAAASDLPVLLMGETGTGKEIAARAIHALSRRAHASLVTVNMAALNEALAAADLFGAAKGAYTGAQSERKGLFAEADGATLFLDEIGNAPASVQPMLLRVLEGGDYRPLGAAHDRQATARLIAASDQNLDSVDFNQALLRRLEGFVIQLPPLRQRREDIGVLIVELLGKDAGRRLPSALVLALACYDWPGNIRQLARALQRALLMLDAGTAPQFAQLVRVPSHPPDQPGHAPATVAGPTGAVPARRKPSSLSHQDILDAMGRHGWTIQHAAHALGISRPTLYKLLERHPEIRRAEQIPVDDIKRALFSSNGDVERCAALLKTPAEPLRRLLHKHELVD